MPLADCQLTLDNLSTNRYTHLTQRRHYHQRNPNPLLRRMAHRCQQSRLRRRHRHGCRSDVHALPQRAKRHRAHALAALLNRCLFTPPLLETVAPPKCHTVGPRFRPRYRLSKPHFKGHFRCSSQESDRRHRLSIRRTGIPASVLATAAQKLGAADHHSTPIQIVARTSRGSACRCLFDACTHGWTRRRHVSPPATLKQHRLRRNDDRYLFLAEPYQNAVLLPTRSFLF